MSVNLSRSQPFQRKIAAIQCGLLIRAFSNFVAQGSRLVKVDGRFERVEATPEFMLEKHVPQKDRPQDSDLFARMRLIDLSAELLMAEGWPRDAVLRMPEPQRAMAALGFTRRVGPVDSAVHTTGSLAIITQDAVNKSLLAGYEEAPQTWRGPLRQGTSVSDFKTIHRVKLGAAGNLPVWNDNTAPELAKLSNEQETYAVEARAETLSFSWKSIVNDDIDALSRRPQLLGDAAGRTVNYVAWQSVLANPTMADGQALFLETPAGNRKRSNLTTGAATPTNTTIGAMKSKMRQMRGLNTPEGAEGDDILNLEPRFIVAPSALEEVVLKQVFSDADPASGGNSAVYNTSRTLTPIIEPLLDADSETAWYLFASPGRVDTAEVTFLEGQETPYTHEWMDDATMAQNFTILQTFAAKAIEHRGMQKHAGV